MFNNAQTHDLLERMLKHLYASKDQLKDDLAEAVIFIEEMKPIISKEKSAEADRDALLTAAGFAPGALGNSTRRETILSKIASIKEL